MHVNIVSFEPGGAIPFRGVVRKLSGAESHDRLVQSAIIAGNVRRAYLKGLGEARGCMPPAKRCWPIRPCGRVSRSLASS